MAAPGLALVAAPGAGKITILAPCLGPGHLGLRPRGRASAGARSQIFRSGGATASSALCRASTEAPSHGGDLGVKPGSCGQRYLRQAPLRREESEGAHSPLPRARPGLASRPGVTLLSACPGAGTEIRDGSHQGSWLSPVSKAPPSWKEGCVPAGTIFSGRSRVSGNLLWSGPDPRALDAPALPPAAHWCLSSRSPSAFPSAVLLLQEALLTAVMMHPSVLWALFLLEELSSPRAAGVTLVHHCRPFVQCSGATDS